MQLKIQITNESPVFFLTVKSATHREKSLLKDDNYYNLTNEQKFHVMSFNFSLVHEKFSKVTAADLSLTKS